MARKTWNSFLETYKVGHCFFIGFPDYRADIREARSGKVLPSPNQTLSHLGKLLSGDFVLKSHLRGKGQQVVVATKQDAEILLKLFECSTPKRGNSKPCVTETTCVARLELHADMAKKFGIF